MVNKSNFLSIVIIHFAGLSQNFAFGGTTKAPNFILRLTTFVFVSASLNCHKRLTSVKCLDDVLIERTFQLFIHK